MSDTPRAGSGAGDDRRTRASADEFPDLNASAVPDTPGTAVAAAGRIERRTSTLNEWEGEGGATRSGAVPERMPAPQGGFPPDRQRTFAGPFPSGSFQQGGYTGGDFGLGVGRDYAVSGPGPRPGIAEHTYPPNRVRPVVVSNSERLLMTTAGGALAFYGLRNPTPGRLLLGLVGIGLAYQGATGGSVLREVVLQQEVARVPLRGAPVQTAVPPQRTGIRVKKSLTVNRPASELYRYWRELENLPRFMHHVQEVHQVNETRSHWRVRVLRGMELEWDAQITVDRPDEMIAWETLPGARVHSRGYVKFVPAPRDQGTEVHVSLEYQPPLGALGQAAAGMFNFITEQQVKEDIRNFKQIMEAGEIPTTAGQPQGGRR